MSERKPTLSSADAYAPPRTPVEHDPAPLPTEPGERPARLGCLGVFEARDESRWARNTLYEISVEPDRLVAVKIASRFDLDAATILGGTGMGLGEVAGTHLAGVGNYWPLFGGVAGAIIGALYQRSQRIKREAARGDRLDHSLDELLRQDTDNFEIPFGELASMELKPSGFLDNTAFAKLVLVRSGEKKRTLMLSNQRVARLCENSLRRAVRHQLKVNPSLRWE